MALDVNKLKDQTVYLAPWEPGSRRSLSSTTLFVDNNKIYQKNLNLPKAIKPRNKLVNIYINEQSVREMNKHLVQRVKDLKKPSKENLILNLKVYKLD